MLQKNLLLPPFPTDRVWNLPAPLSRCAYLGKSVEDGRAVQETVNLLKMGVNWAPVTKNNGYPRFTTKQNLVTTF